MHCSFPNIYVQDLFVPISKGFYYCYSIHMIHFGLQKAVKDNIISTSLAQNIRFQAPVPGSYRIKLFLQAPEYILHSFFSYKSRAYNAYNARLRP